MRLVVAARDRRAPRARTNPRDCSVQGRVAGARPGGRARDGRHPAPRDMGAQTTAIVGVLASHSGFSKQAKVYMRSSRLPLLFLHLAPQDQEPLVCQGFLWNDALANGPLHGRFEPVWVTTPQHTQQLTLYRDGIRAI